MSYFNIKRDKEIINNGGFFYQACLIGKDQVENSPDPRYCITCHYSLLKEAEMDTSRRQSDWKPRQTPEDTAHIHHNHVRPIMSTLNRGKSTEDMIQPGVTNTIRKARGPKRRDLPDQYIKQLFEQGLGSKAITTRLNKEQGVDVSYKTIQRALSGGRR